jgi:hypothetical protein
VKVMQETEWLCLEKALGIAFSRKVHNSRTTKVIQETKLELAPKRRRGGAF